MYYHNICNILREIGLVDKELKIRLLLNQVKVNNVEWKDSENYRVDLDSLETEEDFINNTSLCYSVIVIDRYKQKYGSINQWFNTKLTQTQFVKYIHQYVCITIKNKNFFFKKLN